MKRESDESGDLFEEALKEHGLGKRFANAGPSDGWPGQLIAIVEPIVAMLHEDLVSEVAGKCKVPVFIAGVTAERTFNASAFKHRDDYVIALNFGALVVVQDLVYRLLCIPEAFSWVGDASKEDKDRRFHSTRSDADDYMRTMIATPLPVQPLDPVRRSVAKLFTPLAVDFILAHEFWHAIGGHLEWMRDQGATSHIDEVGEMSSIADDKRRRLERQALEVDADGFAMYHSLRRTLGLSAASQPGRASHVDGPEAWRNAITTDDQALYTSLMCGIVMVGTFFGATPGSDAWQFRTHPPAGVRLGLMLHSADKALRALKRDDLLVRTLRNPDWIAAFSHQTFVRLWARMGNDERPEELSASFGPPGQAHMKLVLETWGRIAQDVKACSPVGPLS